MAKPRKSPGEIRCCLGCGSDTRGDYCWRCVGRGDVTNGHDGRGRRRWLTDELPLEDDYSEESDADSVCEDNSASVSRVF